MTSKKTARSVGAEPPRERPKASAAYWGRAGPMRARTLEELGVQAKHLLWRFVARTRLRGVARDKAAVALIRNRLPATKGVFSDQAIAAVLREPADGTCHWCAFRVLTAAGDAGEQMPSEPDPGHVGLLGRPCARCRGRFAEAEAAAHERRFLASGGRRPVTRGVTGPQPTGVLWPAGKEPPAVTAAARRAARQPLPSYYRPGPGRLPRE